MRAAQLATLLDHWMLERDECIADRGGVIATGFTNPQDLPSRSGTQLSAELGGRRDRVSAP